MRPESTSRESKLSFGVNTREGATICRAGEYGSTAFLLLEGSATASLPTESTPATVQGRTPSSLTRLQRLFRRRARRGSTVTPTAVDVGEVSRYATVSCENPPLPQRLGPGDFFGIDTCINFYPREVTVVADEPCVVLEMLRSVLDSIRDAGNAGGHLDETYRAGAVRSQLFSSSLFRKLSAEQVETIAGTAALLTPDSDRIRNNVIYSEGDAADGIYLVRAGTVKLSQRKAGGEAILTYVGRGAAFGLEGILPSRQAISLRLECTSHPSIAPVAIDTVLTIGRSRSCDVALPDDLAITRKHCRLEKRDGDLYLVDLNSANGTLLNGESVQETMVTVGDRLTVVDYQFEIRRAPIASDAPPVRFSAATALDNVEIVEVPYQTLRQVGEGDARFLEALGAAARALDAAAGQPTAEHGLRSQLVDLNLYNSQNVLLIDLDRCTRCDQCVRACASVHDGVARFTRDGPRLGSYLVTMACRSCTDPKCMIGCPVGSIRRTDSLEVHIEDWCIGCQRCANQCPFGNINMLEVAVPAPVKNSGGEATPPALRATVCDLCAGYDGPNCVYACPHDAAIRVNPASFLGIDQRR